MFAVAAIFRAAISQNSQKPNIFRFKKRQYFVIQNIGGGQRIFTVIKFDERRP